MKSFRLGAGSLPFWNFNATLAHETDFVEVFLITNVSPPSQLFRPANAFPNPTALPFTLTAMICTGSFGRDNLLTVRDCSGGVATTSTEENNSRAINSK